MTRKRSQCNIGYACIVLIIGMFSALNVSAAFTTPGVIGHRGGGKASDGGPENTIGGINRGFELGIVMAELDMQYSSDGVPILLHDTAVNAPPEGNLFRTTGETGDAKDFTFAELQQMNAANYYSGQISYPFEPIPSLADAINAAEGQGPMLIERKSEPEVLAPYIAAHMTANNLSYDNFIIGVNSINEVNVMKQWIPDARFALWPLPADYYDNNPDNFNWSAYTDVGIEGVYVQIENLTREWVDQAHDNDLWIMTASFNKNEQNAARAANAGVDFILNPQISFNVNFYETYVAGDLNDDTIVNATDIDFLVDQINTSSEDLYYDLNTDFDIDMEDVESIVTEIIGTAQGDVTLDRIVNLEDLARLATFFGQSSNVGWGEGDLTGDGVVDLADLARLATDFGIDLSGGGAASGMAINVAIPEPASLMLLGLMLGLGIRKR